MESERVRLGGAGGGAFLAGSWAVLTLPALGPHRGWPGPEGLESGPFKEEREQVRAGWLGEASGGGEGEPRLKVVRGPSGWKEWIWAR